MLSLALLVLSGRFEDLTADEQPGFIITTGDFKHSFVVSSRSEQKRWVTCLRDLSCLEEVECRQVTPRTARSSAGLGDEEEASRLKQQLVKERGRSDRLQLKIEDLLSEQRGLRKALDAALTMMSDCHRGIATPRALSPAKKEGPSNLQSNHPTEQDRGYALVAGLEMAQQLETTSQSLHATETTISALVWELSSLVQQRDAAFSSLSTLRGSEDAYDLASASEVGAVKHEHEHRSGTPMQKRLSSSSIARPLRPTPITVPEHEEGEEKTITPSPRDTTGRLPRKVTPNLVGRAGTAVVLAPCSSSTHFFFGSPSYRQAPSALEIRPEVPGESRWAICPLCDNPRARKRRGKKRACRLIQFHLKRDRFPFC